MNLIISLDLIRPALGNLFTFHFKRNLLKFEVLLWTVDYRQGAVPILIKKKNKVIIPHCCEISDFTDWIILLFSLIMTKNALGRMKHLEDCRDQLTACFFLFLAFMAWFCDCSVIQFWNCKGSHIGPKSLAVIFQSTWSLPWKAHVPKHIIYDSKIMAEYH